MAKTVKQFVYNPHEEANGKTLTYVIEDYYIYAMTVTALPGTELHINNNVTPIVMGQYGMYRLDINDNIRVDKLQVTPRKINDEYVNYPIIIDLVCEPKGGYVDGVV